MEAVRPEGDRVEALAAALCRPPRTSVDSLAERRIEYVLPESRA